MQLPNLERFLFASAEAEEVRTRFDLLASDVKLHAVEANLRSVVPRDSGCYFWTLRLAGRQYKIYVGRTRSMRKRFADYANEIQIHAPNDYKLRFFQEFVFETEPAASFDLYFMPVPETEFKQRETELVRRYKPLINYLQAPSATDRERIKDGFRAYYRDAFVRRCADGK